MTPFIFILAALATFRFTILVTKDVGPFRLMERVRNLSPKWLGCPFCFSVTAAVLIDTALYVVGYRDPWAVVACTILALSALSIILDRCFTADYKA